MKTVSHINDITNAILVFIPFLLTGRAVRDGINSYDEEGGIKLMLNKIKKRVFAAVIAITVSSLIACFKAFYI